MNDRIIPMNRRPIVIADDALRTGTWSARVSSDAPEALLTEFLRLIRRARSASRHRNIALRRSDIEALADHLGWTDDEVLTRLAELMGSTRRQRATMLALLATGATLITISQPAVAGPRVADAGSPADIPIVVDAPADLYEHGDEHGDEQRTPAAGTPNESGPTVGDRSAPTAPGQKTPRTNRAVTEALRRAAPGISGAAPVGVRPSEPTDPTAGQAIVDGSGPVDGNDPNGSSSPSPDPPVAVGQPPVPPATDADGNQVAVGQPPVPPATDADGNHVAVGQPPVPPATDG